MQGIQGNEHGIRQRVGSLTNAVSSHIIDLDLSKMMDDMDIMVSFGDITWDLG